MLRQRPVDGTKYRSSADVYSATHALALQATINAAKWISCKSARDPLGGTWHALLDAGALRPCPPLAEES